MSSAKQIDFGFRVARIARHEPEPWVPTEEQKTGIADGRLIAIPIRGGPCISIQLEGDHPAAK